MSLTLYAGIKQDEWNQHENYYQTDYARWNGFVYRLGVLRQIVDIRASSIIKSYRVTGVNSSKLLKILEDMRGRGHESFKQIMANMYKVAWICGDAYAEILFDEDDKPYDLVILPSDNIRQVVKKGKIIRYEEIDGSAKWQPHQIFHWKYKPRGAQTHGIGMVETLNNILIEYEQMIQLGSEMYRKTTNPKQMILVNSDNLQKIQTVRDAVKEAGDTWGGVMVLPKTLIEPDDIKDITLSPTLKPGEWLDKLKAEVFQSTATPELILGTGYSTSEEDAKTRIAGFTGSIRDDQEDGEESLRIQFIAQIFPENQPNIEFSYESETRDQSFTRNLQALPIFQNLAQSGVVAPENVELLIKDTLKDMGRIG